MGLRQVFDFLAFSLASAAIVLAAVFGLHYFEYINLTPRVEVTFAAIERPEPKLLQEPVRVSRSKSRQAFVVTPTSPMLFEPPDEEDLLPPPPPAPLRLTSLETEQPDTWQSEIQQVKLAPSPDTRVSGWNPDLQALPKRKPESLRQSQSSHSKWDRRLVARLEEISPAAKRRLRAKFDAAKVHWPPAEIGLVGLKDEKKLELYARQTGEKWKLVHSYPIKGASGDTGPKLRQGDKQVPEGIYRITFLNPDSKYHVSMRVNYPNAFDKRMAASDGRSKLGGDIMIHGNRVSAGCLAMGDPAAEELFVVAAQTGLENIKLIIAPTDFRRYGVPDKANGQPKWVPRLYTQVASAMSEFERPSIGLLSLFN